MLSDDDDEMDIQSDDIFHVTRQIHHSMVLFLFIYLFTYLYIRIYIFFVHTLSWKSF